LQTHSQATEATQATGVSSQERKGASHSQQKTKKSKTPGKNTSSQPITSTASRLQFPRVAHVSPSPSSQAAKQPALALLYGARTLVSL